jgi:hypothetical protein
MSDDRATQVIADYDAFPDMQNWMSFAENISVYGEERKSGIIGGRTPGQIDNSRIFDTTLREANEIFSAGVVSDLTPQTEPWLEIESQSFNPSQEQKAFFNAASDRVRKRIAQSNFGRGFHEGVHSGGMFGTLCIAMVPSKKKLFNFVEIPYGLYRFREDGDGVPNTVFREFEGKTAAQIQDMFRDELEAGEAVLSDKMKECLNSDVPEKRNEKFTLIHRVMPRNPGVVSDGVAPKSKRPFESVYVVKEENHTLMDNDGFYYQVYLVTRILKSRHDAGMGRSPGTEIYPAVRMLNRAVRDVGVAIEKSVTPPILEPKDSAFQMDLRPGGRIPFDPHVPNAKPEPFYENPNIPFAEFFISRLEGQIKRAFFNDMFKFFTDRDVATTEKTAFETQLQAEEQLRLFTPIFLNIVDECLNRIIENVFTEMFIRGEFQDIQTGEEVGNFSIVYNSRIALAVKTQRTQGVMRLANAATVIEQFAPGAGARVANWEMILGQMALDSTVPAEFLNNQNTIDQLKEKDRKIEELLTALEALQTAGQAASQFQSAQG